MQATVEVEQSGPPGGSDDVFAIAADMIRSSPPPMTSADVVQVAQTLPPRRNPPAPVALVAQAPSVTATVHASGAFGGDSHGGDLFGNVGASYGGVSYGGASYGGASYGGAAPIGGLAPAVASGSIAPPAISPAQAIEFSLKFPTQTFASGNDIYFQGEIMPGMRPYTPRVPRQRTSNPTLLRRFGVARDFMISIATTHHINKSFNYVGSPSTEYVPVAETGDGGFVIVADDKSIQTKRTPWAVRPTVYRIDRTGKIIWQVDLTARQQKFATFESQGVIVAADHSIRVVVNGHRAPGSGGIARFSKISTAGKLEWDVQLPGNGDVDSPGPNNWELNAAGDLSVVGFIALSTDCKKKGDWSGCTRDWAGTISADGRFVSGQPGAIQPPHTPSLPPVKDSMWNAIDPVSDYD